MTNWTRWGAAQPDLPVRARETLLAAVGRLTRRPVVPLPDVEVAPTRLAEAVRRRLVAVVGDDAVLVDHDARALHAGGQSYADLVRRRRGDMSAAPDAVVLPADEGQVAAVLSICAADDVAVVPWGGGTSVVGGLDNDAGTHRAVVALDLSKLSRLVDVDRTSLLATFEPGIRTPAAEAALAEHGLTLGHVPQSFERASIGGYVATRSAGQASTGVGRIDDLVAGLRMVTPTGTLVLPAVAGSAAGPDLRRLVLGSEGTLGVITQVTVHVRPLPAERHYEGWMVRDWTSALTALRAIAQDGPRPDICRLSDPHETAVSMAMSSSGEATRRLLERYLRIRRVTSGGCLLITGYEGSAPDVRHRRRVVRRLLRRHGAVALGSAAGRAWEHSRFAAPALRDTLLDEGVLAETLETAATWTRLPGLYDGVRRALLDALGTAIVGCHVSHLYAGGASLYFTVLAAAADGDEVAQWQRAKDAANDAIVAAGGTITHHHAVGTVHRDHVAADLGGDVGVAALTAVKRALDPAGILNPGKLLPPS